MEKEKPNAKTFFEIIFFVLCFFLILAFVYLKLSKKNHIITKIFTPIVIPTSSLKKRPVSPTKIPQKQEASEQATITEYVITQKGISSEKIVFKLHDFITFKNTTQKEITITFNPGRATNILPNTVWSRSFEALGEYQFTIKGLVQDFEYKISVK